MEPGHGLTGTTPLHAAGDLPERPAMLYLTEVSHLHQGRAYCFGGGLYVDPVFEPYPLTALVGRDPEAALSQEVPAEIPEPAAIDYYGQLRPGTGQRIAVGDTVIFGFRAQAFVTRAFIAPVAGVAAGGYGRATAAKRGGAADRVSPTGGGTSGGGDLLGIASCPPRVCRRVSRSRSGRGGRACGFPP